MLVSHKHKFVFIKTGKTGGTSTEIYLEPYCVNGVPESHKRKAVVAKNGIIGARFNKRSVFVSHLLPEIIRSEIGPKLFDSYTKIANIRNPFDLMVSHYHYPHTYRNHAGDRKLTFHQYIMQTSAAETIATQTAKHLFIGNRYVIDEVLRQESLADDLEALRVKLGLPEPKRSLGNYKESSERKGVHYSEYYRNSSRKAVEKHFGYYLERYGYVFESKP